MKLYDSNLTGSLRVSGAASNESYFVGHNVGVGTNNPRYKLHVVGDSFVDGQLTIRSGVIDSGSVLYTSGSNKFGNDMADEHAFTGSFFATASEYNLMGGKVGIGTRSPGSLLHTYGGNVQVQQGYLQIKAADSTAAYLYLQADNADNSADEFRLQSSTDNFLKFETRDGGSWNQRGPALEFSSDIASEHTGMSCVISLGADDLVRIGSATNVRVDNSDHFAMCLLG